MTTTKETRETKDAEPDVILVEPEPEPLEPHVYEHRLLDVEYDGEPVGPHDVLPGPLGDPVGETTVVPDIVVVPEPEPKEKSAKK
jgi:hypothetical protein